jgi:RNA polymerase sigma-70 factor (ECF subfamily)
MAEPAGEFEALMVRVRAGCPEAAREVFDRYSDQVRVVVRHRLPPPLRAQYDSVDFVQSVWASFFDEPARQYTFATPEALVKFLARVAHNKVVDQVRQRLGTQKRDLSRERSLDDAGGHRRPLADKLPVRGPTPSQVAIASELEEHLLAGQPPELRRALEMLRQGHDRREVAAVLGLHPKLLQRVLRELRRKVSPS